MRYLLFLLSVSVLEEFVSQQTCNRSGFAVADHPSVDLHNSDDLGSGTGEEKLVADIQIKSREIFFNDLNISSFASLITTR